MKDLLIIGAGPAGLTAAIYGIRAGLDVLIIEKYSPGGQVINTYEVENYPGFTEPIKGWELMSAMEGQVRRLGAEILNGDVKSVRKNTGNNFFEVELTDSQVYKSKAVILASGSAHNLLNIPGEAEFTGKGVSYCATCDGAFFKDKITAVNGGGNTALEEALFLTKFASKVYLIHRRDQFRGSRILQDRILSTDKIVPVYNSVVQSITGSEKVTSINIKNVKTGEESRLIVDGLFIFIGYSPNTGFLPTDILNEKSEVIVDRNMQTSVPGLFAAGDMREFSKKQIVMAASDGATAALSAYDYIFEI